MEGQRDVCVKHSSMAKNIVLLLLEPQGGSHAISGQGLVGRVGGNCQQLPGTQIKTASVCRPRPPSCRPLLLHLTNRGVFA